MTIRPVSDYGVPQAMPTPNPKPSPQLALHQAMAKKNLDAVKRAFDAGANVNEFDRDSQPIHFAAQWSNVDIVSELLNRNANVNSQGHDGETPLQGACDVNKDEAVIKLLLDKKADPNPVAIPSRHTVYQQVRDPLYLSIKREKLEACQLLIAAKACLNATWIKGKGLSPLKDACLLGNRKIVDLLLKSKADPNFVGDCFETDHFVSDKFPIATPLGCSIDRPAIVELLLNNKASVSTPTGALSFNRNDLPIHLAVRLECPETLELLIDHGADPCPPNTLRATPLLTAQAVFESRCEKQKIAITASDLRNPENMDPSIRNLGLIIRLLKNPNRKIAEKPDSESKRD